MKNIHILPTDNYSPLVYSTNKYGGLFLSKYYSPTKDMEEFKNINWLRWILATLVGLFLLNGIVNAVQNLF